MGAKNGIQGAPGLSRDWRCSRCEKLLGMVRGTRLHIQFARGHDYIVSLPAVASCRGCGVLNEISSGTATAA